MGPSWEIREILIGERHVVELTTGRAHRGGRNHEWEALGLIRIEGGLIAECWLVPLDLYRFDEAWSEIPMWPAATKAYPAECR